MLNQHAFRIRLTVAEERELWLRMRGGDIEARNDLVESQVPWVMRLAKRMRTASTENEDLVSVGLIALIELCLPKFEPQKGRLSTYCVRPVYWAMRNYEATNVPLSRSINRNPKFGREWDAAATVARDVPVIIQASHEDESVKHEEIALLRAAIEQLPARQRFIIEARLSRRTLRDIGGQLGISRERVRQIETEARNALQDMISGETSDTTAVERSLVG